MTLETIKQRSDYTFKYNKKLGRHGWLRLTPAYSVKLVQELSEEFKEGDIILEPFSGTATTSLVLAENNIDSVAFDINPFLVWFGSAKLRNYSSDELNQLRIDFKDVNQKIKAGLKRKRTWVPAIHNIERWWAPGTLSILSSIHNLLEKKYGSPNNSEQGALLWVVFCRLIIETSSAAFNHVSMSFKEGVTQFEYKEVTDLFSTIFEKVVESASNNLMGKAEIKLLDSRTSLYDTSQLFDGIITSPPYPNRMSYIRELRPYMYWTKFLEESRQAGEIDWDAIGGTWGTATSKLNSWSPVNENLPSDSLINSVERIRSLDNKNNKLMALYVHRYFDDIFHHLKSAKILLKPGAKINYIIGNSTFYGVEVKSDIIYMDFLNSLGFTEVQSIIVRKRNSKKGLYEYLIKGAN